MRPKPTGPTALPAMVVGVVGELILADVDVGENAIKEDVVSKM